jgi:hypothetical protein
MFNKEDIKTIEQANTEVLAKQERSWRNQALKEADIELLKVQDDRGVGLVSDWRDYRNALRDWPENENFPNSEFRPISPKGV